MYFKDNELPPALALIALIKQARGLLVHGVEGQPLTDDARALTSAHIQMLCRRLDAVHMAPDHHAVSIEAAFDLAVDLDAYVTQGDGHEAPIEPTDVGLAFAFRQMLVATLARLPGGGIAAKMLNNGAQAKAALARASSAPRPSIRPRPAAMTAPQPVSVLSPPPEPTPVAAEPEARPLEEVQLDAFRFGPAPLDLAPFQPDPSRPVSPAQGTAGTNPSAK